jgi:tetratricopeptide (TPR) repeat protein
LSNFAEISVQLAMKKSKLFPGTGFFLCVFGLSNIFGQLPPTPSPTPKATLALPNAQTGEISRDRLEQSYAKLFEAQRYMLGINRTRSQAGTATGLKLAKQALQTALELNPNLSEAYTLLAEISLSSQSPDIEEAILLATISTKLNTDNFGARRILARVYTIKSRLPTTTLDPTFAQKAIDEWKEVARLDPRNAEAWAFLSEFFDRLNRLDERIAALKKWIAAAAPLETRFYRTILGTGEDLSPESAGLKLGAALIKAGRSDEATEILSQSVADDPDNSVAIDLLRQAMESSEGKSNAKTLELLQQALFANPTNLVLVELLSEVQIRLGKTAEAISTLKNTIQNVESGDKSIKANLQVSLGDIYSQTNLSDEAIKIYEAALLTFGIEKTLLTLDEQREFATKVFEKMIKTYKNAGKPNEARATIERARTLLGKADLFADKQLISFLRESGKKQEALQAVRSVRKEYAADYSLLRTEATILTELGRVEEGVALIKSLIDDRSGVPSAYYDDFSNYLFISGLYAQARRAKDAIDSAQQAIGAAQNEERRQLATLSLATAQHQSGNYLQAEQTLRGILKKTPGNPMALNNLGYFLLQRNEKIDEAVGLIEKAVRIDPTNSSYLDSLGWGYYKLGKMAEAKRYLKEASRLNPASPTIYEHLGDVYLKLGEEQSARLAWQKALNLSTDSEGTSRIRAKIAQKIDK